MAKKQTEKKPTAKKETSKTSKGSDTKNISQSDAKGRIVSLVEDNEKITVSKDRTTHTKEFDLNDKEDALDYFKHLVACTQN